MDKRVCDAHFHSTGAIKKTYHEWRVCVVFVESNLKINIITTIAWIKQATDQDIKTMNALSFVPNDENRKIIYRRSSQIH